jgi:hypothetical protein
MDTAFEGRLLPGERLVWEGRPQQGLLFTGSDLLMVPFSLLWCGFAIFWTVMAGGAVWAGGPATQGSPVDIFPLFGLLFVGVGLYFVGGRFAVDAWLRDRTRYALTDRRVLIVRAPPFGAFTALSLDRLPEAQIRERGGGAGTIRFGHAMPMFGRAGFGIWSPALDSTPQFLAVPEARKVFDLIQRQASPVR